MQRLIKLVAVCVLAAAPSAYAEDPWRVGVSADRQTAAQALLDAGNALILDNNYAEALERYKKAVAIWEHPAIRFNMVRCLVQLERWLEATESLELALKYGAAPFEQTNYQEALAFKKLLANQTGTLEIKCEQRDVQITLDGQSWFSCPGSNQRRLLHGEHQVVGTKQGFMPRTEQIIVNGGKAKVVSIDLVPLSKAARVTHRWRTWVPWAVVGGGAALAGVGELVHLKASGDNDLYRSSVSRYCMASCPDGDPRLDHDAQRRARIENGIAFGVFGVAGAVAITGGVMVYLNRGRTVYEVNKESTPPRTSARVHLVPLPDGAAVIASGRF